MSLKILFLGGTGEISTACVEQAVRDGHQVTMYNRGNGPKLAGVKTIVGDVKQYADLRVVAKSNYDVVCQFLAFDWQDAKRDIDAFAGQCGQFLFISSASAYRKPWHSGVITEDIDLDNPFMAYSRDKAQCEALYLAAAQSGKLPVTVVRPSHTYYRRLPSVLVDGDHLLWRLRNNKPVLVHNHGASLWTLTHSTDFASAFTRLFGLEQSLGQAYHITDSQSHSWATILRTIATLAGTDINLRSMTTEALVEANEDWRGPLLGDKANDLQFDNAKIKAAVGGWTCQTDLRQGLESALRFAGLRIDQGYQPPTAVDQLLDQLAASAAPA